MKQLYMQNGLSAEDADIVAKTLAKSARAGSPLGAGIAENGLSDFATFFANIRQGKIWLGGARAARVPGSHPGTDGDASPLRRPSDP